MNNIVQIDEGYRPAEIERKQVFGVSFEQQRNESVVSPALLQNIVTENKDLPESAARDLLISLVTLKYTQSNSVCYVKDGQAIGVGAGQQSRIHCTRLAGDKADNWHLRRHPKVLALPLERDLGRINADNAIDLFIEESLSKEEKQAWLAQFGDVALGSDAFFPFGDNIERAARSGVKYIAQPGGSIRDDLVLEAADRLGMVMCFTGLRLFHH